MANRLVATFEASCADCGAVFAAPHLGDFGYGEFLLFGDRGTAYALLNAIDNPVWQLAESLSCSNVLRAVAGVADQVSGQSMCAEQVCPKCHSRKWSYWGGKIVANADVAEASFESFNKLTNVEKERTLLQYSGLDR